MFPGPARAAMRFRAVLFLAVGDFQSDRHLFTFPPRRLRLTVALIGDT